MLYNRRLDGVGYDQWKLSPPPHWEDSGLECQECGISIDPADVWAMQIDEMEPICINCRCEEDQEDK